MYIVDTIKKQKLLFACIANIFIGDRIWSKVVVAVCRKINIKKCCNKPSSHIKKKSTYQLSTSPIKWQEGEIIQSPNSMASCRFHTVDMLETSHQIKISDDEKLSVFSKVYFKDRVFHLINYVPFKNSEHRCYVIIFL